MAEGLSGSCWRKKDGGEVETEGWSSEVPVGEEERKVKAG